MSRAQGAATQSVAVFPPGALTFPPTEWRTGSGQTSDKNTDLEYINVHHFR